MKRIISYFVGGMRTGALFYLLVLVRIGLFPRLAVPPLEVRDIMGILIMSGLMGSLTLIFDELEEWPYLLQIVLHFVATAGILVGTCLVLGWGSVLVHLSLWALFLILYALVWLYQIWVTHKRTERINQALLRRKKQ